MSGWLQGARGRATVGARTITTPLRRRFPRDLYRVAHRRFRAVDPKRWTDADPFAVVAVTPERITDSILETAPGHPQWGRVEAGGWDRKREPFDERPVPVAVRQHFEQGVPWAETPLYGHFRDQLARFGNAWNYTDMAAFERRCEDIERVYKSIRNRGYLRQSALEGGTPVLDEINVDIARDGTLLWRGYGQHRLAIAKVLGLDSVPVFLHRRHAGWQARRERIRSGVAEPDDHPDFRGFEAESG